MVTVTINQGKSRDINLKYDDTKAKIEIYENGKLVKTLVAEVGGILSASGDEGYQNHVEVKEI